MVVSVVPIADGGVQGVDVVDAHVAKPRTVSGRPLRSRAAIRSLTTSLCPYTVIARPPVSPAKIDVVPRAAKRQVDAVVPQALARQAIADAHRVHQVHGALLEHPGTDALDHVLAVVALDDHRVDAGLVQQLPQHQARGPRADDADLCAVRVHAMTCGLEIRRN